MFLQELDAVDEGVLASNLVSGGVAGERVLLGPFGRVGEVRVDQTAHEVNTDVKAKLLDRDR
jgi:hypothetical protein